VYETIRPLLFRLDAERAHRLGMQAASVGAHLPRLARSLLAVSDDRLRQRVWGLEFPNPVGLAAGFDKNGRRVDFWGVMGFGFCEIGSVTARPSPGNPRPRAFRLPADRALVNRMGLNNEGAAAVARRLTRLAPTARTVPLGINIAKTHDPGILGDAALDDFAHSVRLLAPLADYLALNVSCPNTAEGKTFEDPDALDALLARVMPVRDEVAPRLPVLVKLSPGGASGDADAGLVDEIVALSAARGVAGYIATNTAADREGLRTDAAPLSGVRCGGLS
jgi:dihydroorotate dehydrogenase